MRIVEVSFGISDEARISDQTKAAIRSRFKVVSPSGVLKLWRGTVPHREALTLDISGVAISINDDWQCTIFGRSYVECLGALFAVHNFLSFGLDKRVAMNLLETSQGLERLLAQQSRQDFVVKILWLIGGAIVGAGISLIISLGF